MRSLFYLAGLLFFATSSAAHAAVVYEWQSVFDNGCCSATVTLSDAAYARGSAFFQASDDGGGPGILPDPNRDVLGFSFSGYFDDSGAGAVIYENFGDGITDAGYFDFSLTIVGNALVGSIYANNLGQDVNMSSALALPPTLWTIVQVNDDFGFCRATGMPECSGATGRFLLASRPPISVPEPVGGLLLLAGLGGLVLARGRKASDDRRRKLLA